jgi:hypothetical protein
MATGTLELATANGHRTRRPKGNKRAIATGRSRQIVRLYGQSNSCHHRCARIQSIRRRTPRNGALSGFRATRCPELRQARSLGKASAEPILECDPLSFQGSEQHYQLLERDPLRPQASELIPQVHEVLRALRESV